MVETSKKITVVGAGVLGLWQALLCARAGFQVQLIDENARGLETGNASAMAGGMLAPDCEAASAPDVVRDLGYDGVDAWRAVYPDVIGNGSLVVAVARDSAELTRFSKMTRSFKQVDGSRISTLEPDLGGRFENGLLFFDEAHVVVPEALAFLFREVERAGVEVRLGEVFCGRDGLGDGSFGTLIDCRGMAARDDPVAGTENLTAGLRGVRGERIIVKTAELSLARPVRLLHPRHPIYVVPWGEGRFVVGATVIESEDRGGASVKSVLELLGTVFALNPAFGEAEVVDIGVGVRPAFADNVPRAVVARGGRVICVNGAYRHGYLLAPVLGEAVCGFLQSGRCDHRLLRMQDTD